MDRPLATESEPSEPQDTISDEEVEYKGLRYLTLKDLPPSPPLQNIHEELGPVAKYQVFGYAVPDAYLLRLANDYDIAPGTLDHNRVAETWRFIENQLPKLKYGHAFVLDYFHCLVIASNKSRQHLDRAKDLDTIHRVQEILGVHGPPRWYRPKRDWSGFVHMVPPFLSYYGAIARNHSLLMEAYNQIKLYHCHLRDDKAKGFGNMFFTVPLKIRYIGLPVTLGRQHQHKDLVKRAVEIQNVMYAHLDNTPIFTNYADVSPSEPGNFYNAASTALLASTVYRASLLFDYHHNLPMAERSCLALFGSSPSSVSSPTTSLSPSTSNLPSPSTSDTSTATSTSTS
ncbi:hypothetical protein AX17_004879, partial [Amanita inopinata Kibby_2008]